MELFYLEKLMEEAKVAEKIAEGIVDDIAYNAVTQAVNESALMEAQYESEEVLKHGKTINNKIDLSDLASEINDALGLTESVSNINSNTDRSESNVKDQDMKSTKLENAGNPSAGVTDAKKFSEAVPIKQTDFVKAKTDSKDSSLNAANTNAEHKVTEQKSDVSVEKSADATMKAMRNGADANKDWMQVAKKLTEGAEQYKAFVESLRDSENSELVDVVISAFNVVIEAWDKKVSVKKGKMEKLLNIPKDKTISDVYTSGKKLAEDLVAALDGDQQKAAGMLSVPAKYGKGDKPDNVFAKAKTHLKKIPNPSDK